MTEHPSPATSTGQADAVNPETTSDDTAGAHVELRLPRAEAEALLLAIDALQPLFEQLRAEVMPEPEPEPEPAVEQVAAPVLAQDDPLSRATRFARASLQEARAIGERRLPPEQRRAWQEAARRYADATKRTVRSGRR